MSFSQFNSNNDAFACIYNTKWKTVIPRTQNYPLFLVNLVLCCILTAQVRIVFYIYLFLLKIVLMELQIFLRQNIALAAWHIHKIPEKSSPCIIQSKKLWTLAAHLRVASKLVVFFSRVYVCPILSPQISKSGFLNLRVPHAKSGRCLF